MNPDYLDFVAPSAPGGASSSSTAAAGKSKAPLNLFKMRGHQWQTVANLLIDDDDDDEEQTIDVVLPPTERNVMRLKGADMGLYGLCPETDRFYAVVCEICGAAIKPQGLQNHLKRHHGSSSYSSASSTSSVTSRMSAEATSPPKVRDTSPGKVRQGKNGAGLKVKLKNNKVVAASPLFVNVTEQPAAAPPEFVVSSNSNSLDSVSYGQKGTAGASAASGQTAGGKGRHKNGGGGRRGLQNKERHFDPDRHCGVFLVDSNRPCLRSLTCKSHSLTLRRQVQGRSKPFDQLLNEHRSVKEPTRPPKEGVIEVESSSNSSSSVDKSSDVVAFPTIELPSVVLTKLEDSGILLQEMTKASRAAALAAQSLTETKQESIEEEPEEQTVVIPFIKEEAMELEPPTSQPPAVILKIESPVPPKGPTTVALPLSINALLRNANRPTIAVDSKPNQTRLLNSEEISRSFQVHAADGGFLSLDQIGQQPLLAESPPPLAQPAPPPSAMDELLVNLTMLQSQTPDRIDSYYDLYEKSYVVEGLFQFLRPVEPPASPDRGAVDDARALKSCLYTHPPRPSVLNTHGMRRVGGGLTLSRRALSIRRSLLNEASYTTRGRPSVHNYYSIPDGGAQQTMGGGTKRSFLALRSASTTRDCDEGSGLLKVKRPRVVQMIGK